MLKLVFLCLALSMSTVHAKQWSKYLSWWPWQTHIASEPAMLFREVVMFGDSLSDDGRGAYIITNNTWPPDEFYDHGRFTNGRVWIEDVAAALRVPLRNYACGGATSDNDLVQGYIGARGEVKSTSLMEQVDLYLSSEHRSGTMHHSLFVINIGSNDVFFKRDVHATQVAEKIQVAVSRLKDNGAYAFVLVAPPGLEHSPWFDSVEPSDAEKVGSFADDLRSKVSSLHTRLRSPEYRLRVLFLDLHTLFAWIMSSPEKFGFDGHLKHEMCLEGMYDRSRPIKFCGSSKITQYVYFDEFHPTRGVHAEMGRVAIAA